MLLQDAAARFAGALARQAGAVIMKKFGHAGPVSVKSHPGDVLTRADVAANRLISAAIRKRYPGHGIISEELEEYRPNAEWVWIVDPLDGTKNFVTRTPLFGVMIGLARRGLMEIAVIYDPCARTLYAAQRGVGAWCGRRRLRCSATPSWAWSYGCATTYYSSSHLSFLLSLVRSAARAPFYMNNFGSIATSAMYLADGRRDWLVSRGAAVWDYAAPALLLAEAGCTVTNFQGQPWSLSDREFVAGNPRLHGHLLGIVRQ